MPYAPFNPDPDFLNDKVKQQRVASHCKRHPASWSCCRCNNSQMRPKPLGVRQISSVAGALCAPSGRYHERAGKQIARLTSMDERVSPHSTGKLDWRKARGLGKSECHRVNNVEAESMIKTDARLSRKVERLASKCKVG